jgi:hypothetical protein
VGANPFEKEHFKCHRDWEESLVNFLYREAKSPNARNWVFLATRPETKKTAALSALLLSNLIENRPGLRRSAETLYAICASMKVECGAEDFEEWLQTGWLNVARVANMLDAEFRHERVGGHGIPV